MAWLLVGLLNPAAALGQGAPIPQTLPVRAQVCGPGAEEPRRHRQPPSAACVALEVPDTPAEYAIGLMGRPHLPPERGMWFRFDQQDAGFWMRNTLIPLDLLFLDRHAPDGARIVKVAHGVQPCPAPPLPCPTYQSGQPVDHVVELAAGEARRRGWKEGTLLRFSWLEPAAGKNDPPR